jgi:Carboxypeptidase regulatory-like domain/TonB-dependent Receptor Plug Domain
VTIHSDVRESPATARRSARARSAPRVALVLASLAVALAPSIASAQKGTGTVAGIVKDSVGAVIQGVEVVVIKTGVSVRSDARGKFIIAGVPTGSADISFRRVSFAPVILSFPIAEDDTVEAQVTLGAVATALPTTVIDAPVEHQRRLAAFESHRRTGAGHFITRDDIVKRDPRRLTDILRSVPGVSFTIGPDGMEVLSFAGTPRNNCVPAIFMDGLRVRTFNIDEISPVDIEGIELYGGSAGLPPEYNQLFSNAPVCGTVAIWTRIPGKKSGGS